MAEAEAEPDVSRVSRTAFGVARVRAEESTRPDRLFDDPHAAALAAASPPPDASSAVADEGTAVSPQLLDGLRRHIVVRTRFYDDFLLKASAASCRQVVGAGLDSRAFRLAWPAGVRLFEIDLPEVIRVKDAVLARQHAQPRCARTAVGADLVRDWAARLREGGFAARRPHAWLAEGLLVYLDADHAARLLESVTDLSAPGSQLAFEHAGAGSRTGSALAALPIAGLGMGGLGGEAPAWLGAHGWRSDFTGLTHLARRYRRPLDHDSRSGFLTCVLTPESDRRWAEAFGGQRARDRTVACQDRP